MDCEAWLLFCEGIPAKRDQSDLVPHASSCKSRTMYRFQLDYRLRDPRMESAVLLERRPDWPMKSCMHAGSMVKRKGDVLKTRETGSLFRAYRV